MTDEEKLQSIFDVDPKSVEAIDIRSARLQQIRRLISIWIAKELTLEHSKNLVVYSIFELAYSYPKRCHDFIESIDMLTAVNRLVPATTLARALVETVAMGSYFILQVNKCVEARNFEKLEQLFLRFYCGTKLTGLDVKPVHANDALRDLDRADIEYLNYLVGKYPDRFRKFSESFVEEFKKNRSIIRTYDELSEISHPNGLGTQYLYPAVDAPSNKEVVDFYRHLTGASIWQAHHLLRALDSLKNFPERFANAFPGTNDFSDNLNLRMAPKTGSS